MAHNSPGANLKMVVLTALLTMFGTGLPKLWSGADKWTSIGPFGGSIRASVIDPQNPGTLYAGTNSGVFKSTDGGASWNSINPAIAVISLAIDPQTPSTLYAGSFGVFKSIDGGINWSAASSGLPTLSTSPNRQDGPYWDVRALAIAPKNTDTLYAATGRGLFKTADGGASWNAVGGLPAFPIGPGISIINMVSRLAIDPQNPNTVYASANFPTNAGGRTECCSSGVFKTTDGGASWNALTLPAARSLGSFSTSALVIDPQSPDTIYALQAGPPGLFKSTDGGASWFTVNSTIAGYTLAVDPQTSNSLYVSTSNGVLKSTDGGTSWTAAGSGLPGGVGPLVIDPQHPAIVYAANGGGLFKTTDGGANWITANAGLSTLWVSALAIDPQNAGSIYAGTGWTGTVFKSMESGSNWIPLNTAVTNFYPFVLAIDPQNARTLYAGTNAGDFGPAGSVFKSIDAGSTWSAPMSGLLGNFYGINALAIDPKNPDTIYAGSDQGVFRSSDAAGSWNAANSGLPGRYISTLAIDPRTPTTIYAGGSGGVFKSTNSGAEWSTAGFPTNFATVLAIDPQNSSTVYAGSAGGIFKSTDGGTSWTASGSGLPSEQNSMTALVIDPQNSNTLYLATNGSGFDSCSVPSCSGFNDGVFKSADAGASWTAVNSGLTTPHVSSLAIDPRNPSRLYAGTQGGGVFAITFGPAPVVTDFRFDRTSVLAGGSYSVAVSGSNLMPQTFFDVRFNAPGSSVSHVVLNWQRGLVASHDVPAGAAAGTWTVTDVRAHELEADHADTFVPISAVITVSR